MKAAVGTLYNHYGSITFDPMVIDAGVKSIRADPQVDNKGGIYEYLLVKSDTRLPSIRLADDKVKAARYQQQT